MKNESRDYRLIWFQHVHKAAGTSIVQLAEKNAERFFPDHQNGNPYFPDGTIIPLWEFSPEELKRFVNDCEAQGVTFVATEWGMPDVAVLAADPRVTLLTCLRDPFERYISNFYYDLHWGYTRQTTLQSYESSRGPWTKFNYYTRLFARQRPEQDRLGEKDYDAALANLTLFDLVLLLDHERVDLFSKVRDFLSWEHPLQRRENRNSSNIRLLLSFLIRGRLKLLYYRLFIRKRAARDLRFLPLFEQHNAWDCRLFAEGASRRG